MIQLNEAQSVWLCREWFECLNDERLDAEVWAMESLLSECCITESKTVDDASMTRF